MDSRKFIGPKSGRRVRILTKLFIKVIKSMKQSFFSKIIEVFLEKAVGIGWMKRTGRASGRAKGEKRNGS